MSEHRLPERDRPWMMLTYAGHSTAKKSNELYRGNLAKGQTGLSIAFDLPTQTGYDADDELARGEVGKVGVPIAHKGDMHTLLDGRSRPATERLVTRLVARPRGRSLEAGLEALSRLAAERRGRSVAVVTSAVPLSDQQRQRLGSALARLYGREMHLNLDVDPEILGGIRVRVGDEVINGSIADRLSEAERRLAG